MKSVRIFVSSPGDVVEERDRARQVVEQLRRRYAGRLDLKAVLWEELPLQADMSFTDGIDLVLSERGVDIAVFILWSRLGSPLGPLALRPDGTEYRSGTEREFDLMMEARRQSGGERPAILAYTREDDASFEERLRGQQTDQKRELIEQKGLVESFIREEFGDVASGQNFRAYHQFDRPSTFSQRLRVHLQEMLDEMAGMEGGDPVWDIAVQGSPFRGLEAYEYEHAPVFFGREDEILEVRQALRESARNGCAFTLIAGASGSGKSSLARAGVLPAIVEHEVDEQVHAWRSLAVTPGELGDDPVRGLAGRLVKALPVLAESDEKQEALVDGLNESALLTTRLVLLPALEQASRSAGGPLRILLLVDQFEELLSSPQLTNEQREAFVETLTALARSGRVWVLATVRSDFLPQAQELDPLVRLIGDGTQFNLLPPDTVALRRLIEEPARLAGLRFEVDGGHSLADEILREAEGQGELLPLLGHLLADLFEHRTEDGMLTKAHCEEVGGVAGALAKHADGVFVSLPEETRTELGPVLRRMVTMSGEDERSFVRLRPPLGEFSGSQRSLVNAFVSDRLFAAGDDGTVTLSHESLLRAWLPAWNWVEANAESLRVRARVTNRMKEKGILLEGDPLLEQARHLLVEKWGGFSHDACSFIEESIGRVKIARKRRERRRRQVVSGLAILLMFSLFAAAAAFLQGGKANVAAREAEAAKADLEESIQEKDREWQRSNLEEGRAWLERARAVDAKGDKLSALMLAGRAVGYVGYGRRLGMESDEFGEQFPLLLGRVMDDPDFNLERLQLVEAVDAFSNTLHPLILPLWTTVPKLAPTSKSWKECPVAFSPTGLCFASGWSDGVVQLWDMTSGKQLAKLGGQANAITGLTFSPDGMLLASLSGNEMIQIWNVMDHKPLSTITNETGGICCMAFCPKGDRLAIGSIDGGVKIWNVKDGTESMTIAAESGRITDMEFSPNGTRLACVGPTRPISVLDAWTGDLIWKEREIGQTTRLPPMARGLAYSPDGRNLASASPNSLISILNAQTGVEIRKLGGHEDDVFDVAYSPDGRYLASWSLDATIRVWNPVQGSSVDSIQEYCTTRGFAWSPEGYRFVSGGWDGTVRVWDFTGHHKLSEGAPNSEQPLRVGYSPDGTWCACWASGGYARASLFEPSGRNDICHLACSEFYAASISTFSTTGGRIAGVRGKKIFVWDYLRDRSVCQWQSERTPIGLIFDSGGGRLASWSDDGVVSLWEAATGKLVRTFTLPSESICCVALSSDGSTIVAGAESGSIVCWEIGTGAVLQFKSVQVDPIEDLAFSPDSSQVAFVAGGGPPGILGIVTGRETEFLHYESDWNASSVWERPPGPHRPSSPHLIDVDNLPRWPNISRDPSACVAFSQDGKVLASGSESGCIRLWDVSKRRLRLTVRDSTRHGVSSLAFSPDGTRIMAGSKSGSVEWLIVSEPSLDLVSCLRPGLIKVSRDGAWCPRRDEAAWGTDSIPMVSVRRDALGMLAEAGLTARKRAELEMELYNDLGQWHAAAALWRRLKEDPLMDPIPSSVRLSYLGLLVRSAGKSCENDAVETALIVDEFTLVASANELAHPKVALPLRALIGRLFATDAAPLIESLEALLSRFQELEDLQSLEVLVVSLVPARISAIGLELGKEWLEGLVERYSDSDALAEALGSIWEQEGWECLNRQNYAGATEAFAVARDAMKSEDRLPFVLLGQSIAHCLNEKMDDAVSCYKGFKKTDFGSKCPVGFSGIVNGYALDPAILYTLHATAFPESEEKESSDSDDDDSRDHE